MVALHSARRARLRALRKSLALLGVLVVCFLVSELRAGSSASNAATFPRRRLLAAEDDADGVSGATEKSPDEDVNPPVGTSEDSKKKQSKAKDGTEEKPKSRWSESKAKQESGEDKSKSKAEAEGESIAEPSAGDKSNAGGKLEAKPSGKDDAKSVPTDAKPPAPKPKEKQEVVVDKNKQKEQEKPAGKPETTAEAESQPKSESGAKEGTQSRPESKPEGKTEQEQNPEAKSHEPEPKPEPQPEPKLSPTSESGLQSESKPETKKPETKLEPESEAKPDLEPKMRPKPKQETKSNETERVNPKPRPEEGTTNDTGSRPEETARENITSPAEVDCIIPAYHEFPPDLFSHEARAKGGVIVHVLVVFYMFYALAVVCDDYFVASLEECCSRLNLSEDVAGATFMAAGSSAPELFTAILGVLIAKGDVGTGTIVGSAVFNVLFVIGLCGLCSGKDVPVTWWPLFRDSVFYAFTVVILILVIYDGEVTWYESLSMLLLYGVYIDLMKYNTRIHRWIGTTFGIHEEEETTLGLTSTGHEAKNYSSYVPFNNEIDDFAQPGGALRNTAPLDEVIRDSRRRPTLYEAALMMLMTRPFRPKTRFWAAAKRVTHEYKRMRRGEIQHLPSQTSLDPNDLVTRGKSHSVDITISTEADWKKIPRLGDGVLSLIKWCIQAPLLATLHYTVPDCRTARGKKLFMLSFLMSIFWTAVFSYVMVWMVTLIGFTMGIPDSIMGITFLAAGTSIPDAFASLLVSRQGQGDMAIANSIGSNVFDILICLALPWLIQTGMIAPGSIAYINSGGLVWSVVLLFLTIIITIYAIHRSHWFLTRKLGIFLMVVYVFFLVFCSAVEFNLLGYVNPPMCTE